MGVGCGHRQWVVAASRIAEWTAANDDTAIVIVEVATPLLLVGSRESS